MELLAIEMMYAEMGRVEEGQEGFRNIDDAIRILR